MSEPGLVATFYSYKGGVGRSFALANVAAVLAQWGLRVMAVDWDIEAPGLTHYFRPFLGGRSVPGVVDFLEDCRGDTVRPWRDYVQSVELPDCPGQLSLMPAAREDSDYKRILQDIDWDGLYDDHDLGGRLEAHRAEWIQAFDIVLIDSRTGVTDFSGITTAQLPDLLLFFFTANRQSLDGCCDVVQRAMASRKTLPLDRPAVVPIPVPARFELRDEYDRARQWRLEFATVLKPFFDIWVPERVDAQRMIDTLVMPYVPRWSFGEDLAVLDEPAAPGGVRSASYPISFAVETLAAVLAARLRRLELLAESRDEYVLTARALLAESRRAEPSRRPTIFLSFSLGNADVAEMVRESLASAGFRTWSVDSTKTGASWASEFEELLAHSDAMVLLVGRTVSTWVERELEQFQRASLRGLVNRPVMPVILPSAAAAPLGQKLRETMRVYELKDGVPLGAQIANLVGHVQRILDPEAAESAAQKTSQSVVALLKTAAARLKANRPQQALEAGNQAIAAAAGLVAADSRDREAQDLLARACDQTADGLLSTGEFVYAISNYDRALEIRRRLTEWEDGGEAQVDLAVAREKLGDAYAAWTEPAEAIRHYQAAVDIRTRLDGAKPIQAALIVKIGDMALAKRDLAAALEAYGRGFDIVARLALADPRDNALWREQARIGEKMGDAHSAIGNLKDARAAYQRAETIRRRLVQAKPGNAVWQAELAVSLRNLAEAANGLGDLTLALAHYEEAIAIRQRLAEAFPDEPVRQADLATALTDMGRILRAQGDTRTALRHYESALVIQQALAKDDPGDVARLHAVSRSLASLGGLFGALGDDRRETAICGELQTVLEHLSQVDPDYLQDLAANCRRLGQLHARLGELDRAVAVNRQGHEIIRRLLKVSPESRALQRDQSAFEDALAALGPGPEG